MPATVGHVIVDGLVESAAAAGANVKMVRKSPNELDSSLRKATSGDEAESVAEVAPKVSNKLINMPAGKKLMERIAGVDSRRPVPHFAEETLVELHREYMRINRRSCDSDHS